MKRIKFLNIILSLFFCSFVIMSCNDKKKETEEIKEIKKRDAEFSAFSERYNKYKVEKPIVLISAKFGIPLEKAKSFIKQYNNVDGLLEITEIFPDAETEFKNLALKSGLTEQQTAILILEIESYENRNIEE